MLLLLFPLVLLPSSFHCFLSFFFLCSSNSLLLSSSFSSPSSFPFFSHSFTIYSSSSPYFISSCISSSIYLPSSSFPHFSSPFYHLFLLLLLNPLVHLFLIYVLLFFQSLVLFLSIFSSSSFLFLLLFFICPISFLPFLLHSPFLFDCLSSSEVIKTHSLILAESFSSCNQYFLLHHVLFPLMLFRGKTKVKQKYSSISSAPVVFQLLKCVTASVLSLTLSQICVRMRSSGPCCWISNTNTTPS